MNCHKQKKRKRKKKDYTLPTLLSGVGTSQPPRTRGSPSLLDRCLVPKFSLPSLAGSLPMDKRGTSKHTGGWARDKPDRTSPEKTAQISRHADTVPLSSPITFHSSLYSLPYRLQWRKKCSRVWAASPHHQH